MLKEIKPGLFEMSEAMPCNPRKLCVPHYALPNTLGHAEPEEAAARLIVASQWAGQWVGVSLRALMESLKSDYDTHHRFCEEMSQYHEDMWAWQRKCSNRFWFCILTLGIWALTSKPEKPKMVKRPELPFSGIFLFGPDHIVVGLHELMGNDMIKVIPFGEGDNQTDVIFPTEKLVRRVMEVQGIAA